MKIEKLELLLNKVVEYNKPDGFHYKGFLYKDDYQGYYIKVVEAIDNTVIEVNSKLRVNNDDEQYVTQADKPKLMRISLKSWHYRLMKFVLRSKTPTPTTMQNGCPYFWLLIFSLFACPFVAFWKIFIFLLLLVPKVLFYGLEKLTIAWMEGIDDASAYEMYYKKEYVKPPLTTQIFFDKSDEDFFSFFLSKRYGVDYNKNQVAYNLKKDEIKDKWQEWRKELEVKHLKETNEYYERAQKRAAKQFEYERRQAERKAKWDTRMKPIKNAFTKIFASIHKVFTFKGDLKTLIKRTKQVVGALITLLLLDATFFVVEGLAYILMAVVDACITYWYLFAGAGCVMIVAIIIYVLYILFTGWIQNIVNKYKLGKRIWYIEPLIYCIYYPLKYVSLGTAYGLFYVICIPTKFIFYDFLWKIIFVPTGKFLWKVLYALGRGIANSTGVFGEYFNASYTDYCPGIEWVDTDKEK
jgi:hypothetical protein